MVTLSGAQVLVIVVAVVLTVAVVGIFLYLARRLRARRDKILGELSAKPELVQDRAFNRLEMARREAALLARTGTDITRPQDQIAQAQAAFDLHQYPRAYELAQSAHEGLVNSRGRAGLPTSIPGGAAKPSPLPGSPDRISPAGSSTTATPPRPSAAPPPKNRAESHFQIGLLQADLVSAKPSAATTEALGLQQQAQAAFDRSDYTEAFRLALKGRRSVGHLETLAPSPNSVPSPSGGPPDDATGVAERVAGSERCPDCGYPMLAGNAFCRGCGKPRAVATTCSACGEPRATADTFCGRCGARFTP